jgi:hypothetical protein
MQAFVQKIILLFLIVCSHFAMAQIKFSAAVSSQKINKNEFVTLRLLLENANEVQSITPPVINDFQLVSGPNQESGMTSVNGDVKRYIALSYVLQPKGPGNLKIPAATASADGKTYKSNTVTIQVLNALGSNNQTSVNSSPFGGFNPFEAAAAPTPFNDYILHKGENAADKVNRNMFVKLELDKTSCYIGEPVVATYKLYTRLKSESNLVKNPSFNGFSVIDLQQPDNLSYTREKVNGREYNVYIVRRSQLYPLQPGNLELDPAEIENNVHFIKEAYANRQSNLLNDIFQEFEGAGIPPEGMEEQKVTLKSKPASITVKALPDSNVPAGFKGAVGNFDIEAVLEKNNFTTDDAGKLNVIISGSGNLQLVNAPDINWPQGFEAFDPKTDEDLVKTAVPVSGRKMIAYTFTIALPGTYTIPAIRFSYFDTKERKYKTDSTQAISFTVTKGTGNKNDSTAIAKKENAGLLNKFFSNRRWVISLVAILIICGLIVWLKRDKKREEKITAAAAAKEEEKSEEVIPEIQEIKPINYLEKAGDLLYGDSAAFYTELNSGLKLYLSHKLHLAIETINKKNITEQLDHHNISTDTVIRLQQILNEIELQLYAPFTADDKRQQLYNDTASIIQMLEIYKH